MDAVKNFLHKTDKTTSTEVVTETAAPVVQETVHQHAHVETAEAIDREKHIHHHQHRIQPVADLEHKAEVHQTVIAPEVVREQVTEMAPEHQAKLEAQHAAIQPSTVQGETVHTASSAGVHVNEHVHHHVHETITPLIQKETHTHAVQHVVVPVHEKIHEAPIIHATTQLPTMSMADFQKQAAGGHSSSTHSHSLFEGQPKVADH